MAEVNTTPNPAGPGGGANPSPAAPPKPKPAVPEGNPALRMMGLPNLPRKLPSRNWMIFWAISATITSAIIYDKREKNRATAKWRRAVAPLATEPISDARQLPRRLTIYLEAPPGDGLRVAQQHFIEYAKPVLGASGLDWEFVQGRQQGDVRAAVAEKIRRVRRAHERSGEEQALKTDEDNLEELRAKMGLADYEGIRGDVIVGRHTWKEYIRGLHEGWLGSLDAPTPPVVEKPPTPEPAVVTDGEEKKDKEEEKPKKPERPPQPPPHNSPDDYASASIPSHIPDEFSPSTVIPFPHRLGFRHVFVRLNWFFNRRKLADEIGREVAAVCFAASRDWREADGQYEQQLVLQREETDWPKSVFKDEPPKTDDDEEGTAANATGFPKEKIWASPLVVDPRVVQRMRRFELTPERQAEAAAVVVPEEDIEGWIKGSLRSLWRWGAGSVESKPQGPNVGDVDDA